MCLTLILVLLGLLEHQRYHVRDSAQSALKPLTPLILPLLLEVEAIGKCETRCRVKQLLDWHFAEQAESTVAKMGKLPWIDSLPPDHPYRCEVICHYLARSREKVTLSGEPDYADYREATRLLILELLRARVSVDELLAQMRQGDLHWLRERRRNYQPP